jgi:hypothetical protein
MALPLLVPLGAAAVAAYLLLSKSGSSGGASTSPSGGGGGGGGSAPASGNGPSAPGGGTNYVPPSGNIPGDDGSYSGTTLGPGGSNVPLPTSGSNDGQNDLGQASNATGTNADGGILSDLASVFGPLPGGDVQWSADGRYFFSRHPSVLRATGGRGGWIEPYPGMPTYAPPSGTAIR